LERGVYGRLRRFNVRVVLDAHEVQAERTLKPPEGRTPGVSHDFTVEFELIAKESIVFIAIK
jgi:hypothetical protein